MDTAASALEWGQKYGLRLETAEKIAADCVAALETTLNTTPTGAASAYTEEELSRPPAPQWPTPRSSLHANLHYIKQPENTKSRYVIFAPLFQHNIGGVRVLYDLQKWLVRAGLDAIVAVWSDAYTPSEFVDDIVIYPEVISGNPLNSKRVVRYILNVPGKLGGHNHYAKNELLVAHSEALAQYSDGKILQVSSIESFFYADDTVKTINAVYVGKGKDLHIHPNDCIYITRTFPASRSAVADFLRSVKTLYIYDDFSSVAREAEFCGCEIKLIKKDGAIENYPDLCFPSIDKFKEQLHDFIEMTKLL